MLYITRGQPSSMAARLSRRLFSILRLQFHQKGSYHTRNCWPTVGSPTVTPPTNANGTLTNRPKFLATAIHPAICSLDWDNRLLRNESPSPDWTLRGQWQTIFVCNPPAKKKSFKVFTADPPSRNGGLLWRYSCRSRSRISSTLASTTSFIHSI